MNQQRPLSESDSALLARFITAVQAAAADWIGAELAPTAEYAARIDRWKENQLTAWLPLSPAPSSDPAASPARLVVAMDGGAARRFAERVFVEVGRAPDPNLLGDFVAEFANLVAGRAKALALGSPGHFLLGTPSLEPPPAGDHLVAKLVGEFGDVVIAVAERVAL